MGDGSVSILRVLKYHESEPSRTPGKQDMLLYVRETCKIWYRYIRVISNQNGSLFYIKRRRHAYVISYDSCSNKNIFIIVVTNELQSPTTIFDKMTYKWSPPCRVMRFPAAVFISLPVRIFAAMVSNWFDTCYHRKTNNKNIYIYICVYIYIYILIVPNGFLAVYPEKLIHQFLRLPNCMSMYVWFFCETKSIEIENTFKTLESKSKLKMRICVQ